MKKRLFQPFVLTLLLVAAISIFTVSPASAASTAQAHRATTANVSTALAKPADFFIYCDYLITAYPGLNVRLEPSIYAPIVGALFDGQIVRAHEAAVYGTGYFWHNVINGNQSGWSASNWMQLMGNCSDQP